MGKGAKKLLIMGIDPLAHREKIKNDANAKAITFDEVAADYIKAQRSSWSSAKHAHNWERSIELYVSPVIGKLAPAEITTEHILEILRPIWDTKKQQPESSGVE